MSIKQLLLTSFVKGIGKTTGTVTIFGIIGCAWYLYNSKTFVNSKREDSVENENIIVEETNENANNDIETDDDDTVKELETIRDQLEEVVKQKETRNFRKIFDGI